MTTPLQGQLSTRTWALGLGAWILLMLGAPVVTIAFVGCFGAVLSLGALILSVVFARRVLRETQSSPSRHRALGLAAFILGAAAVVASAWAPLELFGLYRDASVRFKVPPPDSPTVEMILTLWWERHPAVGLGALWAAGPLLFSGGLWLLGEKPKAWLLAAFACSGATGPLLLAICIHLLHCGWRSGN